jgi:hypothetical protein
VRYSLTMKPEVASIINSSSIMELRNYMKPNSRALSAKLGMSLKRNSSPEIKVAINGKSFESSPDRIIKNASVINYNMSILRPAWVKHNE